MQAEVICAYSTQSLSRVMQLLLDPLEVHLAHVGEPKLVGNCCKRFVKIGATVGLT
jgi:hypothetical protein